MAIPLTKHTPLQSLILSLNIPVSAPVYNMKGKERKEKRKKKTRKEKKRGKKIKENWTIVRVGAVH